MHPGFRTPGRLAVPRTPRLVAGGRALALAASLFAASLHAQPEQRAILLLGDRDYPPMTFQKNGEPRGMAVELARALSGPLGRDVRVEVMDWNAAQQKVLAGEADGLVEMSASPERELLFDFAKTVFVHRFGFFVRTGDIRIHDEGDIGGRTIGVTAGGLPRRHLEYRADVRLVIVDSYEDGLKRVATGTLDAFAADLVVGAYTIQENGVTGITIAGDTFATASASIAVRKGNREMLDAFNRAIAQLERDGTTQKIQDEWRPQEMLFLSRGNVRDLVGKVAGAGLLVLVALLVAWILSLKRQIRVRRAAELALRESEERLRRLSDNVPDGMVYRIAREADGSMRFLHVSAGVKKLFGLTAEELMRDYSLYYDKILEEDRAVIAAERDSSQRDMRVFDVEVRIRRSEGDVRWIRLCSAPGWLADGRMHWDGIATDVTEKKVAQERVVESEARFRAILQNSFDAIVLMKADHVVFANRAFLSLYGYESEGDVLNKPGPGFLDPESRLIVAERVRHRERGEPVPLIYEVRGLRADGSVFEMEMNSSPFTLHGESYVVVLVRDITERKRSELALRESEARLRATFRAAPFGVSLLRDRRLVEINDYLSKVVGYEREELIGQSVEMLYSSHEEFERVGRSLYGETTRSGVGETEAKVRRKDGIFIDLLLRAAPLDPANPSAGVVVIVIDITERKQAEAALRESEARLREIFEHTNEVIFTVRVESPGRFVYEHINRAAEEFNFRIEDYRAGTKTPHDIFPAPSARSIEENYKRCIAARHPTLVEQNLQTPSGFRYFSTTLVPVLSDDGALVVRIVGFARDVTERKLAEDALRASEEKFRGIFENSIEGIFQISPEGRYINVNRALARMRGYDSPDDMTRSITDIATQVYANPADREEILATLKQHGRIENHELQVRRKDGSVMWVILNARVVRDAAGNTLYTEGTNLDITERKRVGELQDAKARAEAASRAKSVFLANMSHEIRTPMNAILGFSQLLLRDAALTEQQREQLRIIDRNGDHLLSLINDVLEMSKIEANRVTLNSAAFDPNRLVRDLESMFRARAEVKGLAFSVRGRGSLPDCVVGDEGKLRQILINLLGNAVKFTEHGSVTLCVQVAREDSFGWLLQCEVEDTGPGIAPEEMGRLFQYFEQTASGRRTTTGTGLGLAISREFARLMDGDITAESRVGQGSVFRAEIPVARQEGAAAPKAKSEARKVARLAAGQPAWRTLVVDDLADNRLLASELLRSAGFEVHEAVDGSEALVEFDHWQPHCILMDLRMPVMDGFEAISAIRARSNGREVKIIALSASVFAENREHTLAVGADDFLSKPFREAEFFERIRRLLPVEYAYETDSAKHAASAAAKSQPSAIAALQSGSPLPPDLVAPLRRALEEADLDGFLTLLEKVATIDPALSAELKTLATRFEYSRILNALGPAI